MVVTSLVLVQRVEGGKLQGQLFGIQKAFRHEPQRFEVQPLNDLRMESTIITNYNTSTS